MAAEWECPHGQKFCKLEQIAQIVLSYGECDDDFEAQAVAGLAVRKKALWDAWWTWYVHIRDGW